MTKHRKNRSRSHRRSYRGGNGNYSSATTYGNYVNGSGDSQFNRVFDQGTSNVLVGAQGQWAQSPNLPTSQNLSLVQSAGRRRRSSSSRKKRGGLWGQVINQAIVPLSILGMQQTFRKKHSTRRRRR